MEERKWLRHKFLFVIGMAVAFSVLMAFLTLQTAYSNSDQVSIPTTGSSEPQQVNISISKLRDASVDSSVFFKSSNFKPGDKISGFIEVKNDGLLPITYSSYAEKTGGSDRLYKAFLLKVMTEEGQLLYGHEEVEGKEEVDEDKLAYLYKFTGFEPRPLGVGESELLYFEFELPYSFGSKDRSKDWSEFGNKSIPLEKRLEYSKRYQNLWTEFRIVFTASGEPDLGDDGGGDNGGSDDPGDDGGSDDPGDDEPGRDDQPGEDDNDGTDDTPGSDDGTGEDETGSDDDTRSGDETGSDDLAGGDKDQPGSTDKTGSGGGSGERLPNTATSLFNLLLVGIVLLVGGGIWYLLQHVKGERQRMLTK